MPDHTLSAGKLRHRIQLQRFKSAQDPDTGLIDESWSTVATVWASVEPLSVKEFTAASATQAKTDTRITIRYRAGIDATWRAIHNAATYDIHGALPDPASGREYLTLACSTGATDG